MRDRSRRPASKARTLALKQERARKFLETRSIRNANMGGRS